MPHRQIIYASRPFGFDASVLDDILTISRARNAPDGITGTLVCRADLYLQLLEGPDASVQAAFARIAADDRHSDIALLVSRTVDDRLFPHWAMRDDPPRSWMWTAAEVKAGAVGAATPAEVVAIFERLAADTDAEPPARHT